jgi:ATP-binding cassette subfamily E protein 1
MEGFIPTENLRFRESNLSFKTIENIEDDEHLKTEFQYQYPSMKKTIGNFSLEIEGGSYRDSEINILLGENGCGKTTFIQILAGKLEPDEKSKALLL